MKRHFILLLSVMTITIHAQETSGTCGENLTWEFSAEDSTLTISGTGDMYDYDDSNNRTPWYQFNREGLIKNVVFNEGCSCTYVGSYAFYNTIFVKNINLPQILEIIGNYAFYNCGLTDVVIPDHVTTINRYAFGHCDSLRSVTLGKNIITLDYPFRNIGGGININGTQIDSLFVRCNNLTVSNTLIYNNNVTIIVNENVDSITIDKYNTRRNSGDFNPNVIKNNPKTKVRILSKNYTQNTDAFYDIDGDGQLEFVTQADNLVYDMFGSNKTTLLADTSGRYYSRKFVNINNDTTPDIFDNNYRLQESNGSEYDEVFRSPVKPIFVADFNLDGTQDIYRYAGTSYDNLFEHYIYYRQADGYYIETKLEILTDTATIDSLLYSQWNTQGNCTNCGSGIPSLADGMFVRMPAKDRNNINKPLMVKRVVSKSFLQKFVNIDTAIDLDRDGRVDLMSSTTGAVLYNLGQNRYMMGTFPGAVTVKDLNGDGVMDYIIFDETNKIVYSQIYEGNGLYKTQTLMENMNISNVWCYDFDKDGDIDILLPFNYTTQSGYAFLVFFRNDGNNTFKKIENAFDDPVYQFTFYDCRDVDSDGKYEIIATNDSTSSSNRYVGSPYLIRYTDKLKISTITQFDEDKMSPILGDFDNDGIMDYWGKYSSTKGIFSSIITETPNTAPAKMAKPSFELDAMRQMINISWDRGSDTESSALDLTYSLRIGSKSGEGDVWFAAAGKDGKQRSLWGGNVGSNLSQLVNVSGWAEGDYYIAVQAIDPNGLGGAWSDEIVYHHTLLSADFYISSKEISTADTLEVQYQGVVNDNNTYQWDFGDGAEILLQDEQTYFIVYNTKGSKTISLQVTNSDGASSPIVSTDLYVQPVKYGGHITANDHANFFFFDMDGDGILDAVTEGSAYDSKGLMRGKGDGTYVKIAKTYNSDLTITSYDCDFVDMNLDGLVDFWGTTSKGTTIINEGDYDVSFRNDTAKYDAGGWTSTLDQRLSYNCNFSHYSYPDYTNGSKIYMPVSPNDYKDYTVISRYGGLDVEGGSYYKTADFNNDGWLDYIFGNGLFLNNGNQTFTTKVIKYPSGIYDVSFIKDIDSDGYIDLLFLQNEKTIYVMLGDADLSYSRYVQLYMPSNIALSSFNDILIDDDNNGYPDISVSGTKDGISEAMVIYMEKDYKFTIQTVPGLTEYPYVDLNGDGVPDKNYFMYSRITNESPQIPQDIRTTQTAEGVLLQWSAAKDKETPAVQMRYNISVKKKNANVGEENAFVISPLNGLSNDAAIVPYHYYHTGTQMMLPIGLFERGAEYEFQIQSIDLWNAHSDMSAPITFKVSSSNDVIQLPKQTCVDKTTTLTYSNTAATNIKWNVDGGKIINQQGNSVEVSWSVEGVKSVSATYNGSTITGSIYVKKTPSMTFSIPSQVLNNQTIEFDLPEVCRDPYNDISFTSTNVVDGSIRRLDNNRASAQFRLPEGQTKANATITIILTDTLCGETSYTATTQVIGFDTPKISLVTVDQNSNLVKLQFNQSAQLPQNISTLNVYKLNETTGKWMQNASLNVSAQNWEDKSSLPSDMSGSYYVTYATSDGQESERSEICSSVLLKLNKGIAENSVNLSWNIYSDSYNGKYVILRGTNMNNLKKIAEVGAGTQNYLDSNVPTNSMYAIQYQIDDMVGMSNIVSAEEAKSSVLVEQIYIMTLEKEAVINENQNQLHLYVEIMPKNTTYQNVVWSITSGSECASLTSNGLLSGNGINGVVIVRATALDGSGKYAEIEVPVSGQIVCQPQTRTINATICSGDVYDFYGSNYSAKGIYETTFADNNGCDSTIILNLDVIETKHTTINETAAGSYIWNGNTFTQSGQYNYTLVSSEGCDSIVTLNLTITNVERPVYSRIYSASICPGDSYDFYGELLSIGGAYRKTINYADYDSTITVLLDFYPSFLNVEETQTITAGQSLDWNGLHLTSAGDYTANLKTIHGCDSIVTLHLTVSEKPSRTETISADICVGDSYDFFGEPKTTEGKYIHTEETDNEIIITELTLVVHPSFLNVEETQTITAGQSLDWNGLHLTSAGYYTANLKTIYGCDSIVTLHLTVSEKPSRTETISADICAGDSYDFFGEPKTTEGKYIHTEETDNEIIITELTLVVHPSFLNVEETQTITAGQSLDWNGLHLTSAGYYTANLKTIHGCDSIVTLHLTVSEKPSRTETISADICAGDSYDFFGESKTTEGKYIHTEETDNEIIITELTLVVHPSFLNVEETQTITAGQSLDWNGLHLTSAGYYTANLKTIHGCDSIVTLHLNVTQKDTITEGISIEICEGEVYDFFGEPRTTSGEYVKIIEGVEKDTIIILQLKVNPSYHIVEEIVTEEQEYLWNGMILTESGEYVVNMQSITGCDSIVVLNITFEGCKPYALDLRSSNTQNGMVTIIQQPDCDNENTAIIEAIPTSQDYRFVQWSDGNTENPRTLQLTKNTTLYGLFSANAYTITLYANNSEAGQLYGAGTYLYGTEIRIVAYPNIGWKFVEWSDGNTDNPRNLLVLSDLSLQAVFEQEFYTITAVPNDTSLGYTTGSGEYTIKTYAHLTAIPRDDCSFVRWNDGITSAERHVLVFEDAVYTAYFTKNTGLECTPIIEGVSVDCMTLFIDGHDDEDMFVYTITGQTIYNGKVRRHITLQTNGIYLLKIGNSVMKVVL